MKNRRSGVSTVRLRPEMLVDVAYSLRRLFKSYFIIGSLNMLHSIAQIMILLSNVLTPALWREGSGATST